MLNAIDLPLSELEAGQTVRARRTTVTTIVSPDERAAFQAGTAVLAVLSELRYRDWWFGEHANRSCYFISVNAPPLACTHVSGQAK